MSAEQVVPIPECPEGVASADEVLIARSDTEFASCDLLDQLRSEGNPPRCRDRRANAHLTRKGGRPFSHINFRRRGWNEAVKKAGLSDGPKVTPYDARHAFASEMHDLGLTSSDVAEVLGHKSADITERIYTHTFNRMSGRNVSARQLETIRKQLGGLERIEGVLGDIHSVLREFRTELREIAAK